MLKFELDIVIRLGIYKVLVGLLKVVFFKCLLFFID